MGWVGGRGCLGGQAGHGGCTCNPPTVSAGALQSGTNQQAPAEEGAVQSGAKWHRVHTAHLLSLKPHSGSCPAASAGKPASTARAASAATSTNTAPRPAVAKPSSERMSRRQESGRSTHRDKTHMIACPLPIQRGRPQPSRKYEREPSNARSIITCARSAMRIRPPALGPHNRSSRKT